MLRCWLDRRESGQELVEYAMILPLLLVLLVGIIEFSIIIFSYDTIANAAREGARVAIISSSSDADVMAAVIDRALAVNLTSAEVTILRGHVVRVEVAHPVNLMTGPLIEAAGGSPTLLLRTAATMMLE
ncbi:TadE/TadG family type IV pilus assembly protein [Chloroflexota bacterium]